MYHHLVALRVSPYPRLGPIGSVFTLWLTLNAISTQLSPAWLLRLLLRQRAVNSTRPVAAVLPVHSMFPLEWLPQTVLRGHRADSVVLTSHSPLSASCAHRPPGRSQAAQTRRGRYASSGRPVRRFTERRECGDLPPESPCGEFSYDAAYAIVDAITSHSRINRFASVQKASELFSAFRRSVGLVPGITPSGSVVRRRLLGGRAGRGKPRRAGAACPV
jgi:hypothetical protein